MTRPKLTADDRSAPQTSAETPSDGHLAKPAPSRVIVAAVFPEIEAGRFPIKRSVGQTVRVEADILVDGHDALAATARFRHESKKSWSDAPMSLLGNDRWRAEFTVRELGRYFYAVDAWIDRFTTWRHDLKKRIAAGQQVDVELMIGADLISRAAGQATGADRNLMREWERRLRAPGTGGEGRAVCDDEPLGQAMARWGPRDQRAEYVRELEVVVESARAGFSAWYEMFPRSASPEPGRHGTFRDVENRLDYVAGMGFDVLYLPPIHPIGTTFRKGPNNAPSCSPGDVGSPWGIGFQAGGHKAIHPELGTLEDFRRLVGAARDRGIEVALDVALQCSPDHPYVKEHPEWFRKRPDGTIQYAENPPKKYQDIYPFDFESADWRGLWDELKSIFEFWIEQGVKIFRVDNPHTKPFAFWEWLIGDVRRQTPDAVFLSEAFTRPKIMYRLAKLGFSQSYTYFTWRNTKRELTEYMTELAETDVREFFRPNFWPNTPDILHETLQVGGRPAFMSRLVLAATLSPHYGIYGPPFEHGWTKPREPRSEEYDASEKYQLHVHNLDRPDSLKDFIARVNGIRRRRRALQSLTGLRFQRVENEQLLCYSKSDDAEPETLLVVVNLDFGNSQGAWVDVPIDELGIAPEEAYHVHDLLSDARYQWYGRHNYVELNPHICPAHIFLLPRRVGT